MFKIMRMHFGEYIPDPEKISFYGVKSLKMPRAFISITSEDQGFGQIKGTTKKVGANYSPVPVCCFKRETRELLWEIMSKPDGTYRFRNIKKDLECFVVAFDPNNQYNAVISDKLISK